MLTNMINRHVYLGDRRGNNWVLIYNTVTVRYIGISVPWDSLIWGVYRLIYGRRRNWNVQTLCR